MKNTKTDVSTPYEGFCDDCERTVGRKLPRTNPNGEFVRCGTCQENIVLCKPTSKQDA